MSIFFYILFIILLISTLSYCLYTYQPQVKTKTYHDKVQIEHKKVSKNNEIYRSKSDLTDFVYINNSEFALVDSQNMYLFRGKKMIQSIHFESTFDMNVLCTNVGMLIIYTPQLKKVVLYKHNRFDQWYEYQSIVDPSGDTSSGFGFSINYNHKCGKLFIATRTNRVYTFIESPSTNQFYLHSSKQLNNSISNILSDTLYVTTSNYFNGIELDSQAKYVHELESTGVVLVGTLFQLYVFKSDKIIEVIDMNSAVNRYILVNEDKLHILFNHSWIEVSLSDKISCVEYSLEDSDDLIVCGANYCVTKDDVLYDIQV
jgi:hypothetical protein